jgi:hypothetical protein
MVTARRPAAPAVQAARRTRPSSGTRAAWHVVLLCLTIAGTARAQSVALPRDGAPRIEAQPRAPHAPQPRVLAPIPYPADSLRADTQAFDALPPPARAILDVRRAIAPEGGAPGLACIPLSTTSDGSRRQRVQGRIDGLGLVVFARVTREGALARVEFVRRLPGGGQRGYTWDSAGDATTMMEWPEGSTQAESAPVPRGGPIPRAVRALGRIVLTWRCVEG